MALQRLLAQLSTHTHAQIAHVLQVRFEHGTCKCSISHKNSATMPFAETMK